MANVIQSTSGRPDVILENFIKKLDIFIAQSMSNLKKMKSKHQQMAAFWKGEQYDRMTMILNTTMNDAAKELFAMQKLREQLVKKLRELREALNHR